MTPTLLILAAGMGSRYGGLKQVDPMGPHGETLLDYSVFDACRAGFGRVVFVIRSDFEEEFKKKVGSRFASVIPVDYAFQSVTSLPPGFTAPLDRVKPWGTGHAVLAARSVIQENFCVINADDFYGHEAYLHMAGFLNSSPSSSPSRLSGCMVGYRLRQTLSTHGSVSRGICQCDETGHLRSIQEMTKIFATPSGAENRAPGEGCQTFSGDEIVSLNFWGFTPDVFIDLESLFERFIEENGQKIASEFYLPFAIDQLIASKRAHIRVFSTESPWFGVTYREDKAIVQESLIKLTQKGEYPDVLFKR